MNHYRYGRGLSIDLFRELISGRGARRPKACLNSWASLLCAGISVVTCNVMPRTTSS